MFTEALGVYRRERSDTPVLQVAPADRELAQCHAPDLARIEVNDAVPDGVELLSPDRHLRVQNTVPSRLRQGREEFLKTISEAIKERLEKAEVTHDE
jgi:vacuolar-type H+-ATPase subunit E/Vma4